MREDKRRRLESKGWRVGTAAELLGLTPEESAFVEIKLRLSRALRTEREARGLTQTQLAQMMRSSQSRVAKMEACDPSITMDLLVRAFLTVGASPKALAKVITAPERKVA